MYKFKVIVVNEEGKLVVNVDLEENRGVSFIFTKQDGTKKRVSIDNKVEEVKEK